MKRTIGRFFLFIVGIGIGFALPYILDSHFHIKHITVEGVSDVKSIQDYAQKNLIILNPKAEEEILLALNPNLRSIKLKKEYPDTLRIRAQERLAGARIQLEDEKESMIISTDLRVLKKEKSTQDDSLPLVRYYQPLYDNQFQIGDKIDTRDLVVALEATFGLLEKGIVISSIDIANENMIVLSADDFDVYISSKRSVDDQIQALIYTYKELQKAGREFRSIDVRFDKPIIKIP